MNIMDIAKAVAPFSKFEFIGIRPGEKLHEQMIGIDDAPFTFEYGDHFRILPQLNNYFTDQDYIGSGKKVGEGFVYSSENNKNWMTTPELKLWISENKELIGSF
jgi:FlaA1/EpsC-like NDP-sugar epimerase